MRIPGLGGIMQRFQEKMEEVQKELEATRLETTALEGKVRLVAKGTGEHVELHLDPSLLAPEQKERLEEGILTALREMRGLLHQLTAEKMQALGGGLGGLFGG